VFLDPLALFIGSIIPDIEGITALFILPDLNLPLHGTFHSFLGAFLLSILVGVGSWICFTYLLPFIVETLNIKLSFLLPTFSLRCSLISSFIGTFSHIILDAFLYEDMNPWYPMTSVENPLLYAVDSGVIYLFCILCFITGIFIISIRMLMYKK
jgi:membrane-bound metal-dependent hydrolase YbcI (DUF457 family)